MTGAAGAAAGGIRGVGIAATAANGITFSGLLASLSAVGAAVAVIGAGIAGWKLAEKLDLGDKVWSTKAGQSFLDGVARNRVGRGVVNTIAAVTGDDRRVPSYSTGGVHGGPRGVHSLAMVAGGETVVPTHKYPVGEALERVGLGAAAPSISNSVTVTVTAAPGMDVAALADRTAAVTVDAMDAMTRRAAQQQMRPAQNRRRA